MKKGKSSRRGTSAGLNLLKLNVDEIFQRSIEDQDDVQEYNEYPATLNHNLEVFVNTGISYVKKFTRFLTAVVLGCLHSTISFLFDYPNETIRKIQGILFGVTSGILSAHSLLLAKSSIEILILTFVNHEWKKLNNVTTYCIVITFFTLCLSQLYLLNQGLKYISTSVLYPLVFCVYNITNIFNVTGPMKDNNLGQAPQLKLLSCQKIKDLCFMVPRLQH
ncbi:unnamed protein product [Ambrosiozyma monospora]|uniref:Unnamed protein product n=1 Tax=Ambrosiozyma monospora TaxID=43982 RepID=A0ACB5TYX1_AMBMO|nr:unnamed protein product [Ambrosiozyma monospora]